MQPRMTLPPIGVMVKRIVLVNVAVYVISLLGYLIFGSQELLTRSVGLAPDVWRNFFPFLPVWQIGTYGFLHSEQPMHLLYNMLGLYFFGTMVEATVGSTRFLVHYLAAIAVGGLAFLLLGVITGDYAPVVGASGGVLAMIVAAACFSPNRTVIFILFPIQLKYLAGAVVGLDLINGALSMRSGGGSSVAHVVHLAGAAYGFLAVKKGWIWADPVQRQRVRRTIAVEERRQSDAQRMDELLEKIHNEGINSLDRREREFLKRVSAKK